MKLSKERTMTVNTKKNSARCAWTITVILLILWGATVITLPLIMQKSPEPPEKTSGTTTCSRILINNAGDNINLNQPDMTIEKIPESNSIAINLNGDKIYVHSNSLIAASSDVNIIDLSELDEKNESLYNNYSKAIFISNTNNENMAVIPYESMEIVRENDTDTKLKVNNLDVYLYECKYIAKNLSLDNTKTETGSKVRAGLKENIKP